MPGMIGAAPTPQAVNAAADFLAVIKLAGSPDVQEAIARLQQVSDEAQVRLTAAQQLEVKNTAAAADIGRREQAVAAREMATGDTHAVAKRDAAAAAADRQEAARILADARDAADKLRVSADAKLAAADAAQKKAEDLASAAAADREAAAAERAAAADVHATARARLDRISAAAGA